MPGVADSALDVATSTDIERRSGLALEAFIDDDKVSVRVREGVGSSSASHASTDLLLFSIKTSKAAAAMTDELADFASGDTAFALTVTTDGKPDAIEVKRVGLDRGSRARGK